MFSAFHGNEETRQTWITIAADNGRMRGLFAAFCENEGIIEGSVNSIELMRRLYEDRLGMPIEIGFLLQTLTFSNRAPQANYEFRFFEAVKPGTDLQRTCGLFAAEVLRQECLPLATEQFERDLLIKASSIIENGFKQRSKMTALYNEAVAGEPFKGTRTEHLLAPLIALSEPADDYPATLSACCSRVFQLCAFCAAWYNQDLQQAQQQAAARLFKLLLKVVQAQSIG